MSVNEDKNLGATVEDRETEQGVRLPPLPDPPPAFQIQVKAELMNDFERFSTGSLLVNEYAADVSIDDKKVGSVAYGLGAAAVVRIGRRTYRVSFSDLFEAIYEAEQNSNE